VWQFDFSKQRWEILPTTRAERRTREPVSQKIISEPCGARLALTRPAEAAGFGLHILMPSEARLRHAWPKEDTSHDPRAPKAHAQLVPASEPR
jgi:hypothetical protein